MDKLSKEIKDYFNHAPSLEGRLTPFESKAGDHIVRGMMDLEKGIFIESAEVPIDFKESFAGIQIKAACYTIGSKDTLGITIKCKQEDFSLPVFMKICESFYNPEEGSVEDNLENPTKWFIEWKKTIGNRLSDTNTYQIIAELMSIKEMYDKHYSNILWEGPRGAITDISAKTGNDIVYVEVKSTIQRTSTEVTMPEEYEAEKSHYLSFYRFEKTESGEITLIDQIKKLEELGFTSPEFEMLKDMDSSKLKTRYHLVEKLDYRIDDSFPNIKKGFIDGKKPAGIGHIEYGVILGGLNPITIPESQ